MAWIGAAIAGLVAAGTAYYNYRQNKKNTQKTIDANKYLAEKQFAHDKEMWAAQNAYNDPSAQMARLKQAGINPNYIYGSGGGATGNSSQYPHYQAPNVDYTTPGIDIHGVLSQYQDVSMKQAQIDMVKAQKQAVLSKTATDAAQRALLGTKNTRELFNLERANYNAPYQTSILSAKARSGEAEIQQAYKKLSLMNAEEQLKLLEADYKKNAISQQGIEKEQKQADLVFQQYKNEWIKQGVTTSDSPMLRIFVRMMNELGISPMDWFKSNNPYGNKTKFMIPKSARP